MRKLLLSFFIVFVSFAVNAQETGDSVLRSKKGIPILPQAGDWAIGADAGPYLSYLGNIFNNTTNNSLNNNDYTIYGRYYLSDITALRIRLRVGNSSNISQSYKDNDAALAIDPLSEAQIIDKYKYKYMRDELSVAYIKFRGYGRLKGFYGIEAGFGLSRESYEFSYGNEMTVANTNPTSTLWGSFDGTNNVLNNQRTLEVDYGFTKNINLGLVAGVEFYFAPKMCIGTEISLTESMSWYSQRNSKFEKFEGGAIIETDKATRPSGFAGSSLYSEYGSNFNGSLYLMFHF